MLNLKKNKSQQFQNSDKIDIGMHREVFNFSRIWLFSFLLTSSFAIVPVVFFAVIDYNAAKRAVASDAIAHTSRLTSNNWRSIAFFLNERQNALKYVIKENNYKQLKDPHHITKIIENLRNSFGRFTDLGVIDKNGVMVNYVGPYELKGKKYNKQRWFKKVQTQKKFISEVFLGFTNVPHLVIAIKQEKQDGNFYVLRAAVELQLNNILTDLEIKKNEGDLFLINHKGILQTPSLYFGKELQKIPIPIPEFLDETKVIENQHNGVNLIIGYRYIPDTPFILMIVNDKDKMMETWRQSQRKLIEYLAISIIIILLWILWITTYFVKRLKFIDKRRAKYLHMAEYSNKLASIGRLAAGVAHEINNPLAIINEKAGLVKDIFHFKKEYQNDPKLMETMDIILNSVTRCSKITRQLLNFAQHMNVSIQTINLKKIVNEVLGFLAKDAEYRCIDVVIDIQDDIPAIESDRGKIQQILFNIINNAFAAMTTGGSITIQAKIFKEKNICIEITDTGCGISQKNLKNIFEPFFSTKTETGGTGLGLSITYSLVNELGGRIKLESEIGKGTTFTIYLPIKLKKEEKANACITSR